jgi:hypothetical protein
MAAAMKAVAAPATSRRTRAAPDRRRASSMRYAAAMPSRTMKTPKATIARARKPGHSAGSNRSGMNSAASTM